MNGAKLNKSQIKSLNLRVSVLREELATCTTAAQKRCVREALEETLATLSAAARAA